MLITTPQKRVYLNKYNLQLTYNNEALSVVPCENILGVFIDNNLTWTNHTDVVVKKLFLIFGYFPELKYIYLPIKEFNFTNLIFSTILIIVMPSVVGHLMEILTGSIGYKKELVKSF